VTATPVRRRGGQRRQPPLPPNRVDNDVATWRVRGLAKLTLRTWHGEAGGHYYAGPAGLSDPQVRSQAGARATSFAVHRARVDHENLFYAPTAGELLRSASAARIMRERHTARTRSEAARSGRRPIGRRRTAWLLDTGLVCDRASQSEGMGDGAMHPGHRSRPDHI
jgi:hypothetical protein